MRIRYPWIEGEAYEVALLTSTGGTIAHEIPVAVETPATDLGFFGLMALLGLYVGVIPIALGHALAAVDAPRSRRAGCASLHGADGRAARLPRRSTRRSRASSSPARARRRSAAPALVLARRRGSPTCARRGVVGVAARSARRGAAPRAPPAATLALLVAVGIGLHNLGEGVAIGSAYASGALALGAFLVVGFALHNTTEGLAIVAPIARSGARRCARLALLGLIAGAPAVLGAWIGAAAFNADRSPRSCSASAPARSSR